VVSATLQGFVVVLRLGAGGAALMADVPVDRDGCPDENKRAKNENGEQNSHRGQHNKRQATGAPIVLRVLKGVSV